MGAFRRLARMRCPHCRDTELDDATIHRCHRCEGTWIDEHTLLERLAAMQLPEVPRVPEWSEQKREAVRACPECAQRMETVALFGIPVDRCHQHGMWFDDGELAAVLVKCQSPELRRRDELDARAPKKGKTIDAVIDLFGSIFGAIH